MAKGVLLVDPEPALLGFSEPAFPGLDAGKVRAALGTGRAALVALGYDAGLCLVASGETASSVVERTLREKTSACVVIGAAVRTVARRFMLFESLVNVVHEHGPQARMCIDTKPDDTAEAVKRRA